MYLSAGEEHVVQRCIIQVYIHDSIIIFVHVMVPAPLAAVVSLAVEITVYHVADFAR
jgi:hypothetical protein